MTFLNQSTCARQWSNAWINSCVTTRFIWDCWRMLFWQRTICRRKDIGSLFSHFQHLPYFSETQHTPSTAFRVFRLVFFNINSLMILKCTRSNSMEHLSFILFSWLTQVSVLVDLILATKHWKIWSPLKGDYVQHLPEMWQHQNLHWHSHHSFHKKSAGHWRQCWKAQTNKVTEKNLKNFSHYLSQWCYYTE